jgi:ABC-type lipoprotein export system ATPase subunit
VSLLDVENASACARIRGTLSLAVRDACFTCEPGASKAIVCASRTEAAGLAALVGGFLAPSSGRVKFRGQDVYAGGRRALAAYRTRGVCVVSTSPALEPQLSVRDNIALPLAAARRGRDERFGRSLQMLDRLQIADLSDALPGELSPLDLFRVGLGRALVTNPEILLAADPDERSTTDELARAADEIARHRGEAAVLFVTRSGSPLPPWCQVTTWHERAQGLAG